MRLLRLVSQYNVAICGSLLVGQVSLSRSFEAPTGSGETVDLAQAVLSLSSFNTEISLMYVYSFASNLLLMDLIGPILTKWTVPLHVMISLGLTAPFIVGYVDKNLFSLCSL